VANGAEERIVGQHLDVGRAFGAIDRTGDPQAFVSVLEHQLRQPTILEQKRRAAALLRLRPGDRVLDVGCGTGHDAMRLAELVGPQGRVVAVDSSAAMIETARRSAESAGLAIEFRVGDATRLDFADASFDAIHSERMLVHIPEPLRALREMVRAVKPGGRVVATDVDIGTWFVSHPDRELTRIVSRFVCDAVANGWMGRQLRGLFGQAGLEDVEALPGILFFTDLASLMGTMSLPATLDQVVQQRLATRDQADEWLRTLEAESAADRFSAGTVQITVVGRKG
jgi:ubiquinone/menaquinone biosynthesis C-methylase UbiE